MNKPEKKIFRIGYPQAYYDGYNQAWKDWDKWYKEEYDKPLQELVPSGSEFVDNPKRCLAHIKERLDERLKIKRELIKLKNRED